MRICFLFWIALAASASAACGNAPSKDQCRRLLDHMVSLEAESGGSGEISAEMKEDIGEKFMTECLEQIPRKQVKCALKARNLEAVAQCDEG